MDLRPLLELKLLDCQETITAKGLCAELGITLQTAQSALTELVDSLQKSGRSSEFVYYIVAIVGAAGAGRQVVLRCRPVASFVSGQKVIAVASRFRVQDLVETDVEHLVEGRFRARILQQKPARGN